mmetsp:Transcript_28257/g.51004  ORF Transcript_28257/g.51004 Transcript_28257/m.51004 type:complete len:697 (-) Transcript_28257:180-2270(-)
MSKLHSPAMADTMSSGTSDQLPCTPDTGDQVHVIGHGPAVFLEAVAAGDAIVYKVRYTDGTQDSVSPKEVLASEVRPRADSSTSSPPPTNRGFASTASASIAMNNSPGSSMASHNLLASPRGPRQLEYLGRAFDDSRRSIATPSATFSLVATMVGGGVLSLPYAMSQCGLVFGTISLLVAAVASAWTLDMLVDCARATGRDSFELVGHAAFGEFSRKATVALVFAICWLTKVAYFVLLTDLFVPLVYLAFPSVHRSADEDDTAVRRVVACMGALLLSPMCFKSSLSSLKFACFASVGSVVVVAAAVGFRTAQTLGQEHTVQVDTQSILVQAQYHLWPSDWPKALYAFPMFGVSFLCHFNALPTHQELQRPTRYRMRRVIVTTLSLTSVIYLFVGLTGYLYGGCYTCGNILLNFGPDDHLIAVGRGALGMVLMLNFPLICQPCRNALFRLLLGCGWLQGVAAEADSSAPEFPSTQENGSFLLEVTSSPPLRAPEPPLPRVSENARSPPMVRSPPQSRSGPSSPGTQRAMVHVYRRQDTRGGRGMHPPAVSSLEAFDSFMPKDETVQQGAAEPTTLQRCVLTAVLLSSSLLVSVSLKSIMVVWSVVGSTVCFLIAFILPACFWYKVVGTTAAPWRRRAALALVGITSILSLACFVLACLNLNEPPCPVVDNPQCAALAHPESVSIIALGAKAQQGVTA